MTFDITEEKQISPFLRVIAFILVILFLVSLPLAVLAFDAGHVIFNRDTVKALVTDEVVNSYLLPALLEWYSEDRVQERMESGEAATGGTEPDIVKLISFMQAKDWQKVKDELLTHEILTELSGVTVDGTYDWIDSQDDVPQITWKMQSFIDRMKSEHGVNSIIIAFNRLPPCGPDEIADLNTRLAAAPPGAEVLYNLCNFPDPWHEDQVGDYVDALEDVAGSIKPVLMLSEELKALEDVQGVDPALIKLQLRTIRFCMLWAWVIPLLLILLVAALTVRSRRGLAQWLGVPLLAAGMLALTLTLVFPPLITKLLVAGPLSEVPAVLLTEATRIALRITGAIFRPLLIQALIILGLGILFCVLYFTVRRPRSE